MTHAKLFKLNEGPTVPVLQFIATYQHHHYHHHRLLWSHAAKGTLVQHKQQSNYMDSKGVFGFDSVAPKSWNQRAILLTQSFHVDPSTCSLCSLLHLVNWAVQCNWTSITGFSPPEKLAYQLKDTSCNWSALLNPNIPFGQGLSLVILRHDSMNCHGNWSSYWHSDADTFSTSLTSTAAPLYHHRNVKVPEAQARKVRLDKK